MGMFSYLNNLYNFEVQTDKHTFSEKSFSRLNQHGEKRCGRYDPNAVDTHGVPTRKRRSGRIRRAEEGFDELDDLIRLDRENPRVAVKQITMGFSKWAQRYIGTCQSQKRNSYQVKRMEKWNASLQMHLMNNAANQSDDS